MTEDSYSVHAEVTDNYHRSCIVDCHRSRRHQGSGRGDASEVSIDHDSSASSDTHHDHSLITSISQIETMETINSKTIRIDPWSHSRTLNDVGIGSSCSIEHHDPIVATSSIYHIQQVSTTSLIQCNTSHSIQTRI